MTLQTPRKPLRLLVVMPSWVGDCVMATPSLRLLRDALPGSFIGALVRPGIDELLLGSSFFDELHIDRARGVMGPKLVAAKIRPRQYDAALLLTNSFSTALIVRLAFIPRRIGYDRDARGLLLTDRLKPERRGVMGFACVPAVQYYLRLARLTLSRPDYTTILPQDARTQQDPSLELPVAQSQRQAAAELLGTLGVSPQTPYAILNPGGNNPAKRWPAERFAQVAAWLVQERKLAVLVNGSTNESELTDAIVARTRHHLGLPGTAGGPVDAAHPVHALPRAGITLGSLKGLLEGAKLLLTNDTGPRHIGAALGVPTVTLFGPTDPRWTTLPMNGATNITIVADPTLPEDQIADDHPDRCHIDRIETDAVIKAVVNALYTPQAARSGHDGQADTKS